MRRSLLDVLPGRAVVSVTRRRTDIIEGGRTGRHLLRGAVVDRLERRGKQLAIVAADGRTLCVHLGMSGQLLHLPRGAAPARADHIHLEWRLATPAASGSNGRADRPQSDGRLLFRDPRRFGGVWTFASYAELTDTRWSLLGPDAAEISPDQLGPRLERARRPIKAALLDQSVLAGLGNIYADEALHLARIAPDRLACDVRDVAALCAAIRATLGRAIEAGGSTLRDYVDSRGESGWFQLKHAVYGRGGEPCRSCGRALRSGSIAQRTTVWCKSCQQ